MKRFLELKGAFDSHMTSHTIIVDSVAHLEAGVGYATGGITCIHFHGGAKPIWVAYDVPEVQKMLEDAMSTDPLRSSDAAKIEQLRHELKMGHGCAEMLNAERQARKDAEARVEVLKEGMNRIIGLFEFTELPKTRGYKWVPIEAKVIARDALAKLEEK